MKPFLKSETVERLNALAPESRERMIEVSAKMLAWIVMQCVKSSGKVPGRLIKDYPLAVRKRARQIVKARWDRQHPPKQPKP